MITISGLIRFAISIYDTQESENHLPAHRLRIRLQRRKVSTFLRHSYARLAFAKAEVFDPALLLLVLIEQCSESAFYFYE